nr:hypothetical protein GCM10020092_029380 [Actinoplanes digitatis]
MLFIDEVHRFSKTQQDSLLSAVEDRTVTLLAATTENPYFSVISPLLSRCVLLTLQALGEDDVRQLIRRAVTDPRGLGGAVTLAADAEDHLVRLAGGDVRKALTALEAAAGSAQAQQAAEIDLATAEKAVDVAAIRYDRDGDAHYDVTSAFIKSMRGSDPDAALHWLARMLVAERGPAVHRPAHRDLRERGRRHGRSAGAACRHGGRAGGPVGGPAGGAAQPRAGGGAPGDGPEVQQRDDRPRRCDGRRPRRTRRCRAELRCATRTTLARVASVTAPATAIHTTTPRVLLGSSMCRMI